jgi:hypothetical protein
MFPAGEQPKFKPHLGKFVKVEFARAYPEGSDDMIMSGRQPRPPIAHIDKITVIADSPDKLPVTVSLKTDKPKYNFGDPIGCTVTIKNHTDKAVELALCASRTSLCKDYARLWSPEPENLGNQEHPYGLPELKRIVALERGGELKFTFRSSSLAPEGTYQMAYALCLVGSEWESQSEIGEVTILPPADKAARLAAYRYWLKHADIGSRPAMAEAMLKDGDDSGVPEILDLLERGVYFKNERYHDEGCAVHVAWVFGGRRGREVMAKLIDQQTSQEVVLRMIESVDDGRALLPALDGLLTDKHPMDRDDKGLADPLRVCDIVAGWLAGYTDGKIKFPQLGTAQERDKAVEQIRAKLKQTPEFFSNMAQRPATAPAGMTVRQRKEMLLAAMQAEPPDLAAARRALEDVGNVDFGLAKGPVPVQDAAIDKGKPSDVSVQHWNDESYYLYSDALNRLDRGPAPASWLERLSWGRKDGFRLKFSRLAVAPTEETRRRRGQPRPVQDGRRKISVG